MISSKSIYLLKTFSDEEFKKFGLFLSSPFHCKDMVLKSLYDAIKKFYPEFESSWLTKEKIFNKIYPKKNYNDSRMRNLLSDLLKSAQEFLAISRVKEDRFKMDMLLAEELILRDQKILFDKNYNKLKSAIENELIRDKNYYERKSALGLIALDYKKKYEKQSTRVEELKLEIYDILRIYFSITAMYMETEISNSSLDRFSYSRYPKERKELERYLDVEAKQHYDLLYVKYFYNMYKLGRTQERRYYDELRDIIKNDYNNLNEIDKRNIFTILTNYCYYVANKGETDLHRDQFELYRENVERGYYKMGKYLTHITYFNTVITGLEVKEFKWVDDYIENYINELEEQRRSNAYSFCKALYYYHNREFDNALEMATKVVSDEMTYKHQLKSLYLKIYYDMNEIESFYSNIDGYKHFINSERYVTAPTKPVFLNYINFAKKLFDIKNRIDEKDYDFTRLKNDVINEKAMINKPWLLQKIKEIELLI